VRLEGHLGGWLEGGDPATWFPDLWQWFIDGGVRSVIDVGCGAGAALRWFQEHGLEAVGVDGLPPDEPDLEIVTHDYSVGPYVPDRPFDLCWCCEFVEHVEEHYVPNFLATFTKCALVAMTHGFPGQPGWHHVNCRSADYWVGVMAGHGYFLAEELTREARKRSALNTFQWRDDEGTHVNHFLRSGLVFSRV
jgi:Methyltransferase domain